MTPDKMMKTIYSNIMDYRKMMCFHWTPSDIYHVIQTLNNCHSPASSSIFFISYYGLPRSFIVSVREINMFFLEKLRMELKYHHYDVTDVEVFIVFYHTKTTTDTKTQQRIFHNVKTALLFF